MHLIRRNEILYREGQRSALNPSPIDYQVPVDQSDGSQTPELAVRGWR